MMRWTTAILALLTDPAVNVQAIPISEPQLFRGNIGANPGSCISIGKYMDKPFYTTIEPTFSDCYSKCLVIPGCTRATYDARLTKCHFNTKAESYVDNRNFATASALCSFSDSWRVGEGLESSLFKQITDITLEDCQAACNNTAGCSHFSYFEPNICRLIDLPVSYTHNDLSGVWGQSNSPVNKCYIEGRAPVILKKLEAKDGSKCARDCIRTGGCVTYTHDTQLQTCTLTTDEEEAYVGGDLLCNGKNNSCLRHGISYTGGNIDEIFEKASDVWDCQAKCNRREKCAHFTYNVSTSQCWLKLKIVGKAQIDDAISGPKKCFDSQIIKCSDNFYFADGEDLKVITTENISQCFDRCMHEPDCFAYTYAIKSQVCELKRSGNDVRRNTVSVSGYPSCAIDPCHRAGVRYSGVQITRISEVLTPIICASICRLYKACTHFTLTDLNVCVLLSDHQVTNENSVGHISGPRSC